MGHPLFLRYYKDHDDYYIGLQNFVLHLHAHYPMICRNYGASCNIGCFGQKDLIGAISSHHNSTRCYGESICHYYNIDFFLNRTIKRSLQSGPLDPTGHAADITEYAYDYHAQLCNWNELNKCVVIYRRSIIREHKYYSLLYKKCQQSISYFAEYFANDRINQRNYGVIQYFLTCSGKAFALIQRYTIKQLYSNYFTPSKYYKLLKNPLDSFFLY